MSSDILPNLATYVVIRRREGCATIGIRFKRNNHSLQIATIHEHGLIATWNLEHPNQCVQVDDSILAVNDSCGKGDELVGFIKAGLEAGIELQLVIEPSKWTQKRRLVPQFHYDAPLLGTKGLIVLREISLVNRDESLLLYAVRKLGKYAEEDEGVLTYAPVALKADKEFILLVVAACGRELRFVPEDLRADADVVLTAISQDGNALRYASDSLRGNQQIALMAISQSASAIRFIKPPLQRNDQELLAVLRERSRRSGIALVVLSVKYGLVERSSPISTAAHQQMAIHPCFRHDIEIYDPSLVSKGFCGPSWISKDLITNWHWPCRGECRFLGLVGFWNRNACIFMAVPKRTPTDSSCWRYSFHWHLEEAKRSGGCMVQIMETNSAGFFEFGKGQQIETDMAALVDLKTYRVQIASLRLVDIAIELLVQKFQVEVLKRGSLVHTIRSRHVLLAAISRGALSNEAIEIELEAERARSSSSFESFCLELVGLLSIQDVVDILEPRDLQLIKEAVDNAMIILDQHVDEDAHMLGAKHRALEDRLIPILNTYSPGWCQAAREGQRHFLRKHDSPQHRCSVCNVYGVLHCCSADCEYYVYSRCLARTAFSQSFADESEQDLADMGHLTWQPPHELRKHGRSLLHWAAFKGFVYIAKVLLNSPDWVNAKDDQDKSPLHYAAAGNHTQVARLLLQHCADVDATECGLLWSAMHVAARHDSADVAKTLMDHGASMNLAHKYGDETPLKIAATSGCVNVVTLLCEHRVDVNFMLNDGKWDRPALFAAAFSDSKNVAEVLLQHSADVNKAETTTGRVSLHCAAQEDAQLVTKLLLQFNADVNHRCWRGRTALHDAAYENSWRTAVLLLSARASVNIRGFSQFESISDYDGHSGLTPIEVALEQKAMDVLKLFAHSDVDSR